MKMLKMILSALVWAVSRNLIVAANVGESQYPGGKRTVYLDEAVTTKNLLMKAGTDADHVAICGASDIPKGFCPDEGAAGDEVELRYLGAAHQETGLGVASGAVAADDRLVPATGGKVKTLPATSGTYWIVGKSIKGAADGEPVEMVEFTPYQVTV